MDTNNVVMSHSCANACPICRGNFNDSFLHVSHVGLASWLMAHFAEYGRTKLMDLFEHFQKDKDVVKTVYKKNGKELPSYICQGTILQLIATGLLDVLVDEKTPNHYEVVVKLQLLPILVAGTAASVDSIWQGIHVCDDDTVNN